MKSTTLLLATTSLAIALPNGWQPTPTPKPPQCHQISEVANFDDLTAIPAVPLGTIPTPYDGLNFQGFNFIQIVKSGEGAGVVPHSGIQFAFSSPQTLVTQGSAEWTTNYPSSTIKSFTLESFYYGCVIGLENGAASIPVACNIAITAFKKGDDTAQAVEVGAQTFTYNPTTSTGIQQQAFGQFNKQFKDLQYVLLQYTVADQTYNGAQANLALLVDDIKYTLCQ